MKKGILVSLAAVVTAFVSLAPAAISPVLAADDAWTASYWNNLKFSGSPALTRQETVLSHDWGLKSPLDGTVRADRFTVRWTRTANFEAGTYNFRASSDDGIRVWVDDTKIIDQWNDHALQSSLVTLDLAAGEHTIKVEYYENTGDASVSLNWSIVSADSWDAQYYNGTRLGGKVIVARGENTLKNYWNATSPAPGVKANNFSARWTRTQSMAAGKYKFKVTVSGGFRLYVDNKLVLDEWYDHFGTVSAINLKLAAGVHKVKLEFYNHKDPAALVLGIAPVK